MGFEVETLKFEGPLDLMLHLIHEEKLDIFDLDMAVLTEQYLNYLNSMEEMHLEIESEYLVELASLIEYKSKMLLPKKASDNDDDLEDPKKRLVQRLLEYQRYKDVSKLLNDAYLERNDQLSKSISSELFSSDLNSDSLLEGNPYDLLKAMNRLFRRIQLTTPLDIRYTQKELSTEERILMIKSRLRTLPESFSFENLCNDCKSIHEYIVTFLAILDMSKDHYLVFSVDDNDNIWFRRGSNNE